MLSIFDLTVSRGGRALFSGVNLELRPGQACALTGANGAGKTSLLRAVAGLIAPDAGSIVFEGPLHFIGHHDGLKPARTAREELVFWSRWDGATEGSALAAGRSLDLVPLLDLEVRRLSAGQRRRLALARLFAAHRPIWLLDEPLSPLDAAWRQRFGGLMQAHLEAGGMILAAVHDPLPIDAVSLELAP